MWFPLRSCHSISARNQSTSIFTIKSTRSVMCLIETKPEVNFTTNNDVQTSLHFIEVNKSADCTVFVPHPLTDHWMSVLSWRPPRFWTTTKERITLLQSKIQNSYRIVCLSGVKRCYIFLSRMFIVVAVRRAKNCFFVHVYGKVRNLSFHFKSA